MIFKEKSRANAPGEMKNPVKHYFCVAVLAYCQKDHRRKIAENVESCRKMLC